MYCNETEGLELNLQLILFGLINVVKEIDRFCYGIYQYIKGLDSDAISVISLIFTVITTIFIIYLTILTLKISAKPRLKVFLKKENGAKFYPSEVVKLRYQLQNIGHWYGKPAAKNVTLYINFESSFEPIEISYGSNLEIKNHRVFRGKKNCKYMKAEGIYLTYWEPGEEVEVKVKMPNEKGNYCSWIAAFSEEGDCGVYKFNIPVTKKEKSGKHNTHT